MLYLWIFGDNVEDRFGSVAIAGVLGAYILLFPQGRVRVLQRGGIMHVPAVVVIGIWIALQLFSGIGSLADTAQTEGGGVAYMAHVGGFVAGFILTMVLRNRGEAPALR